MSVFYAEKNNLTETSINTSSLWEALCQIPDGVYTSFPIYSGGYVLKFHNHFERLRASASGIGFNIRFHEPWIREKIKQAISIVGCDSCRVQLVVSRSKPLGAYLLIGGFNPPSPSLVSNGVKVGLAHNYISKPEIKATNKIRKRHELIRHFHDVNEVLLYNDNHDILEGTSSNFYSVVNHTLFTAEKNILKGITRSVILQIAKGILPIEFKPTPLDMLTSLDEAFITSSSRGVLPVVKIGNVIIGEGRPGPVTGQLLEAYKMRVAKDKEKL